VPLGRVGGQPGGVGAGQQRAGQVGVAAVDRGVQHGHHLAGTARAGPDVGDRAHRLRVVGLPVRVGVEPVVDRGVRGDHVGPVLEGLLGRRRPVPGRGDGLDDVLAVDDREDVDGDLPAVGGRGGRGAGHAGEDGEDRAGQGDGEPAYGVMLHIGLIGTRPTGPDPPIA
jgi:hypothetical protein